MRSISYRVDVLRGEVPYTQLYFSSPPTISSDYTANIHLTLRGEFHRNEDVDYINDNLRPVMILDGAEYPLGVYKIATKRERINAAGVRLDTIEAYDRALILEWAKTETREFFPAGSAYTDIISRLLTRAGIARAIVQNSGAVLQSDREDWDIGTPFLTIINTLLAEINYTPLWFDLTGTARVKAYTAPDATVIAHTYGAAEGVHLLRPEVQSEIDLFSQPNVFIAILENPEYPEPWVKTAVNDTPSSKLSTISRGIRIPQVFIVDNIASEQDLQDYVNKLRNESIQMSEFVSIETAAMPNHNVGDVIAISHPQLSGIFREVSWTLALKSGNYMQHKLQRVVIV